MRAAALALVAAAAGSIGCGDPTGSPDAAPAMVALTVARTGDGTVISTPAGVHCGADCTASFAAGIAVTLTAAPTATSTFAGWSGPCSGAGLCRVTLAEATTVTASFTGACEDQCALGATACRDRGVELQCGNVDGDPCTEWSEVACAGSDACLVDACASTACTDECLPNFRACLDASHVRVCGQYDADVCADWSVPASCGAGQLCLNGSGCLDGFVVELHVTGPGRIYSSVGPTCTGTCITGHFVGTTVVLTPQVAPGGFFQGWSGGGCTGTGPCTISAAATVTATFAPSCTSTTIAAAAARQVVADETHVYWTDASAGTIARRAKAGGAVAIIGTGAQPTGITADATDVYWTLAGEGRVMRWPKTGGAATIVASDQAGPAAIAADATHAYWIDQLDGTVARAPKAGGAVEVLATGPSFGAAPVPRSIAVDATHVYWTNRGAGVVMRVAKTGGAPETIASADGPTGLALGATEVYWTSAGDRLVWRASKTGGEAQVVVDTGIAPAGLVLTGGDLYWIDASQVSRVSVDHFEEASVLVAGESGGGDVFVDAGGVYFTTATAVKVLPRTATCAP